MKARFITWCRIKSPTQSVGQEFVVKVMLCVTVREAEPEVTTKPSVFPKHEEEEEGEEEEGQRQRQTGDLITVFELKCLTVKQQMKQIVK